MSITDQIRSVRQTVGREYTRPSIEKMEKMKMLLLGNDTALDYLRKTRGLTDETIKHFQLGYDSTKHAIAIPVFKNGELVQIKYRFLEPKEMKYIGERNAENWIYNEQGIQVGLQKGGVLVVEGEFDAMSCWQAGIKNVVSPASGKDSYGVWIELLDKIPRVYIAYDNDNAGKEAGRKFAERLGSDRCFELRYPGGIKDANEYFTKHTIDEYRELIKHATPYYSYQFKNLGDIINELRSDHGAIIELPSIPKVQIEKDWLMVISGKSNIGKTTYCMNLARELSEQGVPTLVMPFERGIASVGSRFLQVYFDKSKEDFRFTSDQEWEQMIDQVVDTPVYFATPRREDIKEVVVKAKRLFNTKVVMIDHLDYIIRHIANGKESSEIANTLQELKTLGTEHGIIFMIVTHIRKTDSPGAQTPRDPNIEDLKGSSSLYQDPECVILLTSNGVGTLKVKVAKNKGEMAEQTYQIDEKTGRIKSVIGNDF